MANEGSTKPTYSELEAESGKLRQLNIELAQTLADEHKLRQAAQNETERVRGLLQRYRLKSEDAKVVRVDSIKDWRDCEVRDWSTHHPLAKLTHDYYAEAFRNGWGDSLAPITLYVTARGEHQLEDGFHRMSAAIATGQEYINAQFLEEVGAESADIGKLDRAEKCQRCGHALVVSGGVPVCKWHGIWHRNETAGAETGGEKAATCGELVLGISDDGYRLAEKFHEVYERLAPTFGYETRAESAKPWDEVPLRNQQLMAATCTEILKGGVEGAHEGTTADKSGSREPEKLNNAHYDAITCTNDRSVALAESSLSHHSKYPTVRNVKEAREKVASLSSPPPDWKFLYESAAKRANDYYRIIQELDEKGKLDE